uniref:AcidPPc domain-containing protein n=1 Tax=Meloidogyne hapla TaxID=6305 RepID=A0A1I8BD71_MELHA
MNERSVPLLIFELWGEPNKRGFYCDDESIRYPYRTSTVSRHLLIVIGLLIPASLIFLTEVLRAMVWEKLSAHQLCTYKYRAHNVHRMVVRLYYTIGRQRPHFMEICLPITEVKLNSVGGQITTVSKDFRTNCPSDEHSYITDFKCSGKEEDLIKEAQLSFYSGHSAFSFYAAWYTSLYLQARCYRPLGSQLVLPAVQFFLFCGASFVAYSRVSDYKHHWSDVLVGVIIGSAIGIINALFIAEVFQRREIPEEFVHKRRLIGKYAFSKGDVEMSNIVEQRQIDFKSSEECKQHPQTQRIHNVPIRVISHNEGNEV